MKLARRRLVRSFFATLSIGVVLAPRAAAADSADPPARDATGPNDAGDRPTDPRARSVERPLRAGRLEVEPFSTYSFTPASISRFGLGAGLDYHLTDSLAIGTEGQVWLAGGTPAPTPALWPLQQKLWSGSLDFTYVPLSTARGAGDASPLAVDGFVIAGIGAISTRQIPVVDPTRIFGPRVALDCNVGAGARVFFARSFSVSFGVRDLIYVETPESQTIAATPKDPSTWTGGSHLVNDVQAFVGLSTWFPMR